MIGINYGIKSISLALCRTPISRVYRNLYSPAALGLDNYIKTRERIKIQFVNVEDKFKSKMKDFSDANSNSMVFTEDLKHMIHIIEGTNEDLSLIRQMMLKFARQNKDLRFGSYIFGPVVMRMYYHLNKPEEAFEVFTDPEMDGFFDQLMTFQVLMDLLFENNMFNEVITVFDVIQKKQVQGSKYPKNAVVLVLAACYKLNTKESYEYAKHLWTELNKVGHYPMRRAGTFAAALALNQNAPHIALEILASLKQQTYVTVRNLKVGALAELNRPDDTLPILRAALQIDSATDRKYTFSEEIIARIKVAVERLGKDDITQEFDRIVKQLRTMNQITPEPLVTQLCSEINVVSFLQREPRTKFDNRRPHNYNRPGLDDMF